MVPTSIFLLVCLSAHRIGRFFIGARLPFASPDLDGAVLRDVSLPLDIRVLSIRRDGAKLICHGFTRLRRGDLVTMMGSRASLDQVALKLAA